MLIIAIEFFAAVSILGFFVAISFWIYFRLDLDRKIRSANGRGVPQEIVERQIAQFQKEYDAKTWFVEIFTTAIPAVAIMISLAALTQSQITNQEQIRIESSAAKPILALRASPKPYEIINISKGIALNVVLLSGVSNGNFGIIPQRYMLTAIPPGESATIAQSDLVEINISTLRQILPIAYDYVQRNIDTKGNWIGIVYNDIDGQTYAATLGGVLPTSSYVAAMTVRKL